MKLLFSLTVAAFAVSGGLQATHRHTEQAKQAEQVSDQVSNQISWLTNFKDAQALAKKQSKPLFLFFSGSDWCGWCTKMSKEILDTKEFTQTLGNEFVFVHVDFPKKSPLDAQTQQQNKELADTYNVKGFPTVVVLSPNLETLGTLGYVKGGPQAFIEKARAYLKN